MVGFLGLALCVCLLSGLAQAQVIGITSISPKSGCSCGGKLVTVKGWNLINSTNLGCKFGQSAFIPGTYIDNTTITCVAPPLTMEVEVQVTITNDRQVYTTNLNPVTAFFPYGAPDIAGATSAIGPVTGGSLVTVNGVRFRNETAKCKFGSIVAITSFVSSTVLHCIAPPRPDTASVAVLIHVSFDGTPWANNSLIVHQYVDFAKLELAIAPSAGPLQGGTQSAIAVAWAQPHMAVTIENNNVYNPDVSLWVRYGGIMGVMVNTNNTAITVRSPTTTLLSAHSVSVEISFDGGSTWATSSGSALRFYYYVQPSLLAIDFSSGPASGNTLIQATISNFTTGAPATVDWASVLAGHMLCRFGSATAIGPSSFVPAYFMGASGGNYTVSCTSPPAGGLASTELAIALDAQLFFGPQSYVFYPDPAVTTLNPDMDRRVGGQAITLHGANFFAGTGPRWASTARCKWEFDAPLVPVLVWGTFIDSGRVVCVSPTYPQLYNTTTTVRVSLTLNLQNFALVKADFRYILPPVIASVSPALVPSTGNSLLTFSGENFHRSNNYLGVCSFLVTVRRNQVTAFNSTTNVTTTTGPTVVLANSSTPLSVNGTNGTCRSPFAFNRLHANDSVITVSVQLSMRPTAIAIWSAPSTLLRMLTPVISAIQPLEGPVRGGTAVTVAGLDFPASAELGPRVTCRFGSTAVAARVVSSQSLVCVSPAAVLAGNVSLGVAIDGQVLQPGPGAQYLYYQEPTVTSVSPSLGVNTASTIVLLGGGPFLNRPPLRCVAFTAPNTTTVLATTFVLSNAVRCAVPPMVTPVYTVVSIRVSMNGQQYTFDSQTFISYPMPIVDAIYPNRGPYTGGTVVTVTGRNFLNIHTLTCKFGSTVSPVNARYVTDNITLCVVPPTSFASVGAVVAVSIGLGGTYTGGSFLYSYWVLPTVSGVAPGAGPVSGGNTVAVTGGNYVAETQENQLQCRFSSPLATLTVPASFVTTSALQCKTPAWTVFASLVNVTVTLNNQDYSNPGTFLFIASFPDLAYLRFNPSGQALFGRFVQPIKFPALVHGNEALACTYLFNEASVRLLGNNATCGFIDHQNFYVLLGPRFSVLAGDSLYFSNSIHPMERLLEVSPSWDFKIPLPVTVPFQLPPVVPLIVGPTELGDCQPALRLVGGFSSGSFGRDWALQQFTLDPDRSWIDGMSGESKPFTNPLGQVMSGEQRARRIFADIAAQLEATLLDSSLELEVEEWVIEEVKRALMPGRYAFVLRLRNWLGTSANATHVVVKSTNRGPNAFIEAPPVLYVDVGKALDIVPNTQLSTCAAVQPLLYTWRLSPATAVWNATVDTSAPTLQIQPYTLDGRLDPDGTPRSYSVTVSVTQFTEVSSTSFTLNVQPSPPVVRIAGGSRSHPVGQTLVLSSASFDPDIAPARRQPSDLVYAWTCSDASLCPFGTVTTPSMQVPSLLIPPTYAFMERVFTLAARKRVGAGVPLQPVYTTSVTIRFVPTTYSHLDVAITAQPTTPQVTFSDKTTFQATATSSSPSSPIVSYRWDLTSAFRPAQGASVLTPENVMSPINGSVSSTFIAPVIVFRPSVWLLDLLQREYTLRFSARDSAGRESHSEVTFRVNLPPTSGTLSVRVVGDLENPNPSGFAMQTMFKFRAGSWADDASDLPLFYQFAFRSADGHKIPLGQRSQRSDYFAQLPTGPLPGNLLEAIVTVSDSFGASNDAEAKVTVLPIPGSGPVTARMFTQVSVAIAKMQVLGDISGIRAAVSLAAATLNTAQQQQQRRRRHLLQTIQTSAPFRTYLLDALLRTLPSRPMSLDAIEFVTGSLMALTITPSEMEVNTTRVAMDMLYLLSKGDPSGDMTADTIQDLVRVANNLFEAMSTLVQRPTAPGLQDMATKYSYNRVQEVLEQLSARDAKLLAPGAFPSVHTEPHFTVSTYLVDWRTQSETLVVYEDPAVRALRFDLPVDFLANVTAYVPGELTELQVIRFRANPFVWAYDAYPVVGDVGIIRMRSHTNGTSYNLENTHTGKVTLTINAVVSPQRNYTSGTRHVEQCAVWDSEGHLEGPGTTWLPINPSAREVNCGRLGLSDRLCASDYRKCCPLFIPPSLFTCSLSGLAGPVTVLDAPAGCDGLPFSDAVFDVCRDCDGGNARCADCFGIPYGPHCVNPCGECVTCQNNTWANLTCLDCAGIPHGQKTYDKCGVCGGTDDACRGCDGILFSGLAWDPCGVCNGDGGSCAGCDGVPNSGRVLDQCGKCLWRTNTTFNDCLDCNLVPFGTLRLDRCGVCGGRGSCVGCDNVTYSLKVVDECGVCDGQGRNCSYGCDGVIDSGLTYDICGVCNGTNTSCLDCLGVPFGPKRVDVCGVCGGDGSTCTDCWGVVHASGDPFVVFDRCGVCGGHDTCIGCDNIPFSPFKFDRCGVCGGDGQSCVGCDGVLGSGLTWDKCDVCDGSDTCVDCNGLVYGTSHLDICNVCGGNGQACLGCDGVPFSGKLTDPLGECGGPGWCDGFPNSGKLFDRCGVCDGDDACLDCAGVPFGTSRLDLCFICDGTNGCKDCTGVPFGQKWYDKCGICGGEDACLDCLGVVFGSAKKDRCGFCNPTTPDTCVDCAGVPFGTSYYDACGVCGGYNLCVDCTGTPFGTTSIDKCGVCGGQDGCVDCLGVVHESAANFTVFPDRCGVCGGEDLCVGCDGVPFSGKFFDSCGMCDVIAVNACLDCSGTMYGSATLDRCGVCRGNNDCVDCLGTPFGTALRDRCGVCMGNNICVGCDNIIGGLLQDRCGVCGGDGTSCLGCDGYAHSGAVYDRCGVCQGQDLCVDCSGNPFGGLRYDLCGVCDGKNDTCRGCDGVLFSGAIVDPLGKCNGDGWCDGVRNSGAVVDKCGQCGGADLCVSCNGVPYDPFVLDSCGVCGGFDQSKDVCGVCGGDSFSCLACDGFRYLPDPVDAFAESQGYRYGVAPVVDRCGLCGGNGLSCSEKIGMQVRLDLNFARTLRELGGRLQFSELFSQDLSVALGVPASRLSVEGFQEGSIIVDFAIYHSGYPGDRTISPKRAAMELQTLFADPTSRIYHGRLLRAAVPSSFVLTCAIGCDAIEYCDDKLNEVQITDTFGKCGGPGWCDAVPNSGLQMDLCGVCNGDNTTCYGCDGVVASGLVVDFCGVCGGNNTCRPSEQFFGLDGSQSSDDPTFLHREFNAASPRAAPLSTCALLWLAVAAVMLASAWNPDLDAGAPHDDAEGSKSNARICWRHVPEGSNGSSVS